jgi:hypothetical protein
MTRRLQTIIALLFASIVFCALAQSALADWLVEGGEIKETLATTSEQEVKFEDSKTIVGKAAVTCRFTLDGTVSPEEKGEVTEVLNTSKEKIGELGGLALLCTSVTGCEKAAEAEVWPIDLPWLTKIETIAEEEAYALNIDTSGSGEPGWEILCLVLGVTVEDSCTGPSIGGKLDGTEATGLLSVLTESGKETCSQSKEASGSETGEGRISLTSGEHFGLLTCVYNLVTDYASWVECRLGLFPGIYSRGYNDVPYGG